jgi:hypothetical protein
VEYYNNKRQLVNVTKKMKSNLHYLKQIIQQG